MSSRQQNAIRQIREIVLMNLQSIPQRWGASLVIVVGIAGVVAVLVAMLSMSAGLTRTLGTTGRMDRAVVLRGGSTAELSSFLDRALVTLIKQDPAIARHPDGLPFASGELIVITEVPRKGDGSGANVSLPPCLSFGPVALRTTRPSTSNCTASRSLRPPPIKKEIKERSILNAGDTSKPVESSPA